MLRTINFNPLTLHINNIHIICPFFSSPPRVLRIGWLVGCCEHQQWCGDEENKRIESFYHTFHGMSCGSNIHDSTNYSQAHTTAINIIMCDDVYYAMIIRRKKISTVFLS